MVGLLSVGQHRNGREESTMCYERKKGALQCIFHGNLLWLQWVAAEGTQYCLLCVHLQGRGKQLKAAM